MAQLVKCQILDIGSGHDLRVVRLRFSLSSPSSLSLYTLHLLLFLSACLFQNEKANLKGVWLTQSIEHATLDLGVVSSSCTLGVETT